MALKAAVNLFFERDARRDSQRDTAREAPKERDKARDTGEFAAPAAQHAGTADWGNAGDDSPKRWDSETATAVRWFLASTPPPRPFQLQPGVVIAHPSRYWEYLRGDIAAGPGGPRAHYGALQSDLRKLHALFGPKPEPCRSPTDGNVRA